MVTPDQDDAQNWARDRVGELVGDRWRLEQLLGVGGMAAVYRAVHRNRSQVAIKLLRPTLSFYGRARQRFLREGYVANTVGHPGAVSVLDDGVTADGTPFLVMELLAGETLDERLTRLGGRIEPSEALQLAVATLEILAAAHDNGIVHRDIKPANLFITAAGEVKVLDFGIAHLAEPEDGLLTASGDLMGTPNYTPPEQARGRSTDLDGRADLWALGATLFRIMSGRPVHRGVSPHDVLIQAVTTDAPPFASVVPDAHPCVARLVDRALVRDRDGRWPAASAMRQAALDALQEVTGMPYDRLPLLAGAAPEAAQPGGAEHGHGLPRNVAPLGQAHGAVDATPPTRAGEAGFALAPDAPTLTDGPELDRARNGGDRPDTLVPAVQPSVAALPADRGSPQAADEPARPTPSVDRAAADRTLPSPLAAAPPHEADQTRMAAGVAPVALQSARPARSWWLRPAPLVAMLLAIAASAGLVGLLRGGRSGAAIDPSEGPSSAPEPSHASRESDSSSGGATDGARRALEPASSALAADAGSGLPRPPAARGFGSTRTHSEGASTGASSPSEAPTGSVDRAYDRRH